MLLKHSLNYAWARGFPGVVNLLAIFVFTRILSASDYGHYALIISGAGLVNAIFFQWLRLGLLRFYWDKENDKEALLSTVFFSCLALVAGTTILGVSVLLILPYPLWNHLIFLGLLILWLEVFFGLNLELVRCQFSPTSYGFLGLSKALISLVLGGGLAYLGYGAIGLLLGVAGGFFFPLLGYFRSYWRVISLKRVKWEILRQIFRYGWPLTITFAMGFVINSSDRFILGWYMGAKEAGLYSVGYDLAKQTIGMVMMIVNLAAYPLAVHALENGGHDAACKQLSKNALLLLGVGLPSTAGLILLAPNIAEVFLGQEFILTASALIPWIAIGAFLAGIKSYYFDLSFQLGCSTFGQVVVVTTAAAVNVILNILWIPQYGLLGAAYSTVVAFAVSLFMSWKIGRQHFDIPLPIKESGKIILATAIMGAMLLPLTHLRGPLALTGQISIGGGAFCFLVWVLNVNSIRTNIVLQRFLR